MALLNFDATQVAPDTGVGDPIPAGWYNVAMDESEIKPTKDNAVSGSVYLQCRFNVLDGAHAGRKLFARFNIKNANPTAQEIAYKQLSAVCHAVGVLQVGDSQLLHGRPLKVRVKIRKGNSDPSKGDTFDDSNEITAYKNVNEPVDAGQPAAAAAPGGFAAQPWANASTAAAAAPTAVAGYGTVPAPTAAQAPTAAPAAIVLAPPPAAALPPIKTMTAKANGATYESFISAGWSDQQMVEQGYLTIAQPTAPAVSVPAVPAVPAAPTAPAAPSVGPTTNAATLTPPWVTKQ